MTGSLMFGVRAADIFLNPAALAGLAGILLPVIAHLLSRRRYDVVDWAAMQFLAPSRRSRRRLRLEELLLLLVRMLIVGVIVFAMARPIISSGRLFGFHSGGSRDVVVIIDGSASMSRSDGLTTLHDRALRFATEFITSLSPGDGMTVIDARDLPVRTSGSLLQDRDQNRLLLSSIPPPSGAGSLLTACEDAVAILGRSSQAAREIIVCTDRQKAGWQITDETAWDRFQDLRNFPAVKPQVWVHDVSSGLEPVTRNVSLGQVEAARSFTVPGFPLQLRVPVRNAADVGIEVPVQVSIDGQRMAGLDQTISLPPAGDSSFQTTVQLHDQGTHVISLKAVADEDAIPADDVSSIAIQVTSALNVLMIHQSEATDPVAQNTFFAAMALSAPENTAPWIRTRTMHISHVTAADLQNAQVVMLCDITETDAQFPEALQAELKKGTGLLIEAGPQTTPAAFQRTFVDSGLLTGVALTRPESAPEDAPATIAPYSLEVPWLARFRERKGTTLLTAAFRNWWKTQISDDEEQTPAVWPVARLTTGDPLLLQTDHENGRILLLTSSIDTSWNSLPSQPDYVPFLHEALFHLASPDSTRNVRFGELLSMTLPPDLSKADAARLVFAGPYQTAVPAEIITPTDSNAIAPAVEHPRTAQTNAVRLSGIHVLTKPADGSNSRPEILGSFVVNSDHSEDSAELLTADDRAQLTDQQQLTFVSSLSDLQQQMYTAESRTELWSLLMWLFLALLLTEVWLTRRAIRQGYSAG
ncbi:MAG: BatA domain-containing protein [Planctomycetaceae bacterium]